MLSFFSSFSGAETFQEKALWKMSFFYCNANPNFLQCINPQILPDLQSCITYVVRNTVDCSAEHLNIQDGLSDNEQMNIAMQFTQCSLLELLEAEGIEEAEFNECFSEGYDESKVSPILGR